MGNLKKLQLDGVDIQPVVSEYETYDSNGRCISNKYANKNTVNSLVDNAVDQIAETVNSVVALHTKIGIGQTLNTPHQDNAVNVIGDIYAARDNMKQSIVDALSAKGISASASESIESLISKIDTIEVGSDIPEWYVPTNPYSNAWVQATKASGSTGSGTNQMMFGSTYTAAGTDIYFIGGYQADLSTQTSGNPVMDVYCYNSNTNQWSSKKAHAATSSWGGGSGIGVMCHASTYHNGYIYVCGGVLSTTSVPSNTHYRYNVANDTWESRRAMPYELAYHAYHTIGNNLYALGGMYDSGYYYSGDVYCYNPTSNSWTTKTPEAWSGGAYECSAVLNGYIYNFNIEYDFFARYDPGSNTWTELQVPSITEDAPVHPVAAAINGNIHVFSNYSDYYDAAVNYHQCYNPTTNSWTTKANVPTYVADTDAAVVNGNMYVVGKGKNHYCYIP